MRYLKTFKENNISIYNPEWEKMLPDKLTILKGQDSGIDKLVYKKANIMLNADMIQISYGLSQWSKPETFEIDIYFVKDDYTEPRANFTTVIDSGTIDYERSPGKNIKNLRLNVDMTFGDEMACEFTIDKNGVRLLQHTTYGSKFDPSNTIFAISDDGLNELVTFFNRFNQKFKMDLKDLYFLRSK